MNLWILWHNKDSQTLQFLFVILGLKTAAALKVLQTSCCMLHILHVTAHSVVVINASVNIWL